MENNKKSKAPRKTASKTPSTDMFTSICQTNFGVACIKEYKFHPERRWRFDFAIPQYKIALEIEGGIWTRGRHTRPKGFLSDMEKYNMATLMGWRVFRTTPRDLYSVATITMLRTAIKYPFLPNK